MNLKTSFLFIVGNYISGNTARPLPFLKDVFRTLFFRLGWYSNDHEELERIFQTLKDPWNFETSPYEQERLKLLLEEVARFPHRSILEVGCAEGLFTAMLPLVAKRVVGIDVSQTAVARAQERCPGATFITTSLGEYHPDEKFDLVICAETLYYIRDVREAIRKLSSLGKRCLVSYIERESKRLDAEIERIPGVQVKRYEIATTLGTKGMVVATWGVEETATC